MTNTAHTDYLLIENDVDLKKTIPEFQGEAAIGVDLEADSMFHYQEKVCLVQISTQRLNLLVDPLSVKDLSPLAPVFADRGIRKVFHGADYDMRSLYRDFGIEVHSLFDTQIAAKFLGLRETGLASLLQEKFHVSSDKKYQKKDWSQRPLPAPMLQYGVQDTFHLLPLAGILERELMEKGRLFCVEEECELLSTVRPNSSKKRPFFPKFKGAARLDPRSLAVLENILSFRDQAAKRRDCPHYKVLGNKPIIEIVRIKPVTKNDLAGIKGLSPKQIERMGSSLIEKVREGLSLSEEMLPVYPKKIWQRLRSKESARVKELKSWRDRLGGKWGVDPAVVCTNAQIEAIAIANPGKPEGMESIKGVRKWQIKLFGPGICKVLQKSG
ncbi:MAG: HRDC domain-containing protein [Desulfobacteraceae bacterium]|nr:HRDC domain-containing protein [Desulfobacteraceae bacterium]